MANVTIDHEKLRALLLESYNAGWYGSKELAPNFVEELMEREGFLKEPASTVDFSQVAMSGVTIS
jgi:hypothetical protein